MQLFIRKKSMKGLIFRWVYFVFFGMQLFITPVQAYIDPSVMTYAFQAIAGIMIALGTVFGLYWRKIKRALSGNDSEGKYTIIETNNLQRFENRNPKAEENLFSDIPTGNRIKQNKGSWKERLRFSVFPVIFFLVTFFLFAPSTLYLGNINEFKVEYSHVFLLLMIVICVLFFAFIIFSLMLNNKANAICSALLFSITLCMYLQQNLLNPDIPLFNGNAFDWGSYASEIKINSVIWIIIITVITILSVKFKGVFLKTLIPVFCIILSIMQIGSLIQLSRNAVLDSYLLSNHFVKDKEFEFSSKENTIVIIADTLDATWFDETILQTDAINNELKDFTYYNNCVAGAAPTIYGIPAILTGVLYEPVESEDSYFEHAYSDSDLFPQFVDEGGTIRMYIYNMDLLRGADLSLFDNLVKGEYRYNISGKKRFLWELYRISAYYLAPLGLKENLAIIDNNVVKHIEYESTNSSKSEPYERDDVQFFEDLQEQGITIQNTGKTFTFYHLFGAHGLAKMNENMERINPDTDSIEDRYNEIRGFFKGINIFLDALKKQGIYDSSTIIIAADHGGTYYFQEATILVKEPNIHNDEMIINQAPVTFTNLHSTIREASLNNPNNTEATLEEIPEDLIIERKHSVNAANVLRPGFPNEPLFQEIDACQITFYGNSRDVLDVSYSPETCWPKPNE